MEQQEKDQKALADLADLSTQQDIVERDISAYAHQKLAPVFEKRRAIIRDIDTFWPMVIDKSGLLGDWIIVEDIELLDEIKDIYVEWYDQAEPRNFQITFEFKPNKFIEDSILVKKFFIKDDADPLTTTYASEPVSIKWKKGAGTKLKLNQDSFFKWFDFIGTGAGDFKDGADIANIIAEDLFPHAIKLFVDAADASDDELEDEYDLSDEEEDESEEENTHGVKRSVEDEDGDKHRAKKQDIS